MPYLLLVLLVFLSSPSFAVSSMEPALKSRYFLVLDEKGEELISKGADSPTPIASITKLMTAMVVLDAGPDLKQILTVNRADRDALKNSGSRLGFGAKLNRREMLMVALSASENRAAHALARYYPGGEEAFVRAMNKKANALGMTKTHFRDPTGLNPGNISTAHDLAIMVNSAMNYPLIRTASTTKEVFVTPFKGRKPMKYRITNRFLRNGNSHWKIKLSKTGYISEAGRCLVMRAVAAGKEMTIVLLNAQGSLTPYGDSNRIRKWLKDRHTQLSLLH